MSPRPILALIIPVYHEQDNILSLMERIETSIKIPVKVYVVFDDYDDPTLPVIKKSRLFDDNIICLVKNKYGSGALNAIKTGFNEFSEEACVVTMADGSDDLNTINGMYGLFCQGFHIVCGSRYMRNGGQTGGSFLKRILSKAAGKSLYWLTTIPTHDATNSFKLYTKRCLSMIELQSIGGFEVGMEIVVKSHVQGLAIAEVPTIWKDRYQGESKFKLVSWLPHYLKWYFYLLFRSPRLFGKGKVIYNRVRKVGY
jgi:glycosyltransferase involved in cell wall biosynthesis